MVVESFYFQDHLRLDWGLGNPNKTAALIACLMVAVHGLRFLRHRHCGLILFSIAFLGLGIGLIHTYSRGGILAAGAGQFGYWISRSRGKFRFPSRVEFFCGLMLTGGLVIYAFLPNVSAANRYQLGVVPGGEEDKSITNRLRIWKDTPRMMVDAPGGWGIGESGQAWTQWYQPLSTKYVYRTLVNSHLTWLVELGWVGRILYLLTWSTILGICFGGKLEAPPDLRLAGVSTGIWGAFAVGACFSSIAESWVLWLLPILCLFWMIAKTRPYLSLSFLKTPAIVALVGTAILFVTGLLTPKESLIRRTQEGVRFGEQPDNILIQPDLKIVGQHYGHTIRTHPSIHWLVTDRISPKEISEKQRLVLSGEFPSLEPIDTIKGEILILNPLIPPEKTSRHRGRTSIIMGELRKDIVARAYRSKLGSTLVEVPGKKLYLGDWISNLPVSKSNQLP